MIRRVFFDAGETLVHPDPSWAELAADLLARHGHAVAPADVAGAWKVAARAFARAVDDDTGFTASDTHSRRFWMGVYADTLTALGLPHDPDACEAMFDTFLDPATYALFADARPALEELAATGLRLGIISNWEAWLRDVLAHTGIADLFDVVAISGEVGVEKPHKAIFEWALERSGAAASECAHVGDQPRHDALAAHDAGLLGVLIDRGRTMDLGSATTRAREPGHDYPVVSSLHEVAAAIGHSE